MDPFETAAAAMSAPASSAQQNQQSPEQGDPFHVAAQQMAQQQSPPDSSQHNQSPAPSDAPQSALGNVFAAATTPLNTLANLAIRGANAVGILPDDRAQSAIAYNPFPSDPNRLSGKIGGFAGQMGLAAVAPEAAPAMFGAQGGEQAKEEIDARRAAGQDIGTGQAAADIASQAALQFFMGKLAPGGAISKTILGKLTPEAAPAVVQLLTRQAITAGIHLPEGALQQIASNAITKASGVNPNQSLTEGAGEAAIANAAGGMVGQGVHDAFHIAAGRMMADKAKAPASTQFPVPSAETLDSLKISKPGEVNVEPGQSPDATVVAGQPQAKAEAPQPIQTQDQVGSEAVSKGTGRPSIDGYTPKYRVNDESGTSQSYPLDFESPEDKALHLATREGRKGKVAADATAYLTEQGYKPADIERYGDEVNQRIDDLSSNPPAEGHPLHIPSTEAETSGQPLLPPSDVQPGVREKSALDKIQNEAEAAYKPETFTEGEKRGNEAFDRAANKEAPAPSFLPADDEKKILDTQREFESAKAANDPKADHLAALVQKHLADFEQAHGEDAAEDLFSKIQGKNYLPSDEGLKLNPGAKRVDPSTLSEDHQSVLRDYKALTGKDMTPYSGGKGRGFHHEGEAFYNVERNNTPQKRRETIAHEATHQLQDTRPDLVNAVDKAIPENMRKSLLAEYQGNYRAENSKALPTDQHTREIQAMAVGRAFSRPSVANAVMERNPGAFAKAADVVLTKLRSLTSKGRATNEIVNFLKTAKAQAESRQGEQPSSRQVREKEAASYLPAPDERIRKEAEEYAGKAGLPYHPDHSYAALDEGRARDIADKFTAMKHEPGNPEVKASYDAMKKETLDQYKFLQGKGIKFEPWTGKGQPYKDSAAMTKDVTANKHLYFFQGGDMPSDHPLVEKAPGTPYSYNDVFRAVHDYFGHAKEGYSFGPRGEENAWRQHSQLYSEAARPAMTAETRGQNSWVNFGPHGENNRANPGKTIYAEQKAGLLPPEYGKVEASPSPAPSYLPGTATAKSFVDEDAKPALEKLVNAGKSLMTGIRSLTGKQVGQGADFTRGVLRERGAEVQQRFDKINAAFDDSEKAVGSLPVDQQRGITDAAERGQKQSNPALQPLADSIRGMYEDRLAQIQKHKPDMVGIENYMGHLYKDPDKAAKTIKDLMSAEVAKAPMQGNKGFLKKRTIPYQSDAVAAGNEPVTDNPVTMMRLKIAAMDKYITAQDVFSHLEDNNLLKTIKAREPVPEGYAKIDDNIATTFAKPNRRGGVSIASYKVAPEPVADIINNYLSQGLRGDRRFGGAFKLYMGAGNAMNQAQLGFSAFHGMFTGFNAMVSKASIGGMNILKGNYKEGAKNLVSIPFAVGQDFWNGSKLLKEWQKPGSTDADTAAIVKVLKQGGGRAGLDSFYDTGTGNKMMEAMRKGNYIGAALRLPGAALDYAAAPLMKVLVPRVKMGAFMDMAKLEISRVDGGDDEAMRRAAGKAWDSVENRFGQMTYDNIFWNKAVKDLALATTRSVGWNLGTFRELGGGLKDFATAGKRLAADRSLGNVELTHRMAYTTALPIVTGMIGGAIHYAMTGQAPQQLKDYFYPKTGQKDKNGDDVRLTLPSYMKDVYAFAHGPTQTVTSKIHPMLNTIAEMLENKDYYGAKIRNEDDPFVKQAMDEAKHLASAFEPFGIRGVAKMTSEGQGIGKSLMPMVGLNPAPSYITNTPAEEKASEIVRDMPHGLRTQEQAEKARQKASMLNALSGHSPSEQHTILQGEVEAKEITPEQAKEIQASARYGTHLERSVHSMGIHDAMRVWDVASDAEKQKLGPILTQKVRGTKSLSIDERKQFMSTLQKGQVVPASAGQE